MRLSYEDKCLLIMLGRAAIMRHLLPEKSFMRPLKEIPAPLRVKCGAFVSLYVEDNLRGCIGTFTEDEPLFKNVRRMAVSAASNDSRFFPILAEEVDQLRIEISVLSPRQAINGPDEIEIGLHGIYIQQGMNRGTLLPQVAVTQCWNVEQFLGNCAKYKAGLDWDAWRSAEVFTFEATVFDSDQYSDSVNNS